MASPQTSHRHRYWCFIVLAVLAGAIAWACRFPTDPVHNGKHLSAHLEACSVNGIEYIGNGFYIVPEPAPEPRAGAVSYSDEAREAILHVGTNALPMLVGMLRGEPLSARWRRDLVGKYGFPKALLPTNANLGWKNTSRALAAFSVLGKQALPAVDDLIPLLSDPRDSQAAIVAFMLIKPESEEQILALTNALSLKSAAWGLSANDLHASALLALGSFGKEAKGAIPVMIKCLSSTNREEQSAAAVALARVGAPAETIVPLIARNLASDQPAMVAANSGQGWRFKKAIRFAEWELWALESLGSKAAAALPVLTQLESCPQGNIREAARRASARIRGEPEPAKELGR